MNTLESPLEALVIDYLAYGFLTAVSNIWAWAASLAVITTAVSFWRLRVSSSTSEPSFRRQDAASTSSAPPKMADIAAGKQGAAVSSTLNEQQILSAPINTSWRRVSEREGSTKTKFSLYYKEDNFREDVNGDERERGGCAAAAVGEKLDRCYDAWERKMVVRRGDMGWYNWQDTTVFDGSVVRLWEVRTRRQAALVVEEASCGRRRLLCIV